MRHGFSAGTVQIACIACFLMLLPATTASQSLININTADSSTLQELNGIGPAYAQNIIDYRDANGPFESINEITNVSGIGPATFEDIKDSITVGDDGNGDGDDGDDGGGNDDQDGQGDGGQGDEGEGGDGDDGQDQEQNDDQDEPDFPININTAGADALQTLTGIGPAYAENIITYRQENGDFQQIEDIMNVSGIGSATFEDIQDDITVGDPAPPPDNGDDEEGQEDGGGDDQDDSEDSAEPSYPININTASIDKLQQLDGIGPAKSEDIIEYRSDVSTFYEVEDLMDVSGIGPATLEKIEDLITVGDVSPPPDQTVDENEQADETTVDQESSEQKETSDVISGLININTAAVNELQNLDGIGSTLAQNIVDYRQAYGAFTRKEEIMNVSGIGSGTFSGIRDSITVGEAYRASSSEQAAQQSVNEADPNQSSGGAGDSSGGYTTVSSEAGSSRGTVLASRAESDYSKQTAKRKPAGAATNSDHSLAAIGGAAAATTPIWPWFALAGLVGLGGVGVLGSRVAASRSSSTEQDELSDPEEAYDVVEVTSVTSDKETKRDE